MTVRTPGRCLCTGAFQHPSPDRDDQAVLLGERDEQVRPHDAGRRMVPAKQRLDADDSLALELEHRLVDERELLAGERVAEVCLELHPVLRGSLHRRVEHRVAVLAQGLRLVQRQVGVLQQLLGAVGKAGRNADADRQHRLCERRLGQVDRLAQHVQDPLGDQLGQRVRADGVDDHHELVAAEAPDGVVVAQHRLQPRADLSQDLVAGVMAEAVVDLLEAVDVDEQRGRADAQAPCTREHLLGTVEHERSIGKVGQGIVQGAVGELAGLLVDQAPCSTARARQDAIDEQQKQRDHQTEDQREQTLPVRGQRMVGRARDL